MLIADVNNRTIDNYYEQEENYKIMMPAEFHSRALNSVEKNYSTHDKEMLTIVDCLKKFESQLIEIKFNILTNHASLIY